MRSAKESNEKETGEEETENGNYKIVNGKKLESRNFFIFCWRTMLRITFGRRRDRRSGENGEYCIAGRGQYPFSPPTEATCTRLLVDIEFK